MYLVQSLLYGYSLPSLLVHEIPGAEVGHPVAGTAVVGFVVVCGFGVVVVCFVVVVVVDIVGLVVVFIEIVVGFIVVGCFVVGAEVEDGSLLQFTTPARSQSFVTLLNSILVGQDFGCRKTTPSQQR